jgi:hypothetical protein
LIIWPDDPISSYDLMEIADVCLVAFSTTALENMRLGVPVLCYYSRMGYVDDGYIRVVTNKEQYFNVLSDLLKIKIDYHYLLNAAKFYYWSFLMQSFYLGDNVPARNIPYRKFFPATETINSILYEIFTGKTTIYDYNYKKLLLEQPKISEEDELKSLRSGIYKLINSLFKEPQKPVSRSLFSKIARRFKRITSPILTHLPKPIIEYPIEYFDDIRKFDEILKMSKHNKKIVYILQDGIYCYKIFAGKTKKHTSKAAGRLAKMYQEIDACRKSYNETQDE